MGQAPQQSLQPDRASHPGIDMRRMSTQASCPAIAANKLEGPHKGRVHPTGQRRSKAGAEFGAQVECCPDGRAAYGAGAGGKVMVGLHCRRRQRRRSGQGRFSRRALWDA